MLDTTQELATWHESFDGLRCLRVPKPADEFAQHQALSVAFEAGVRAAVKILARREVERVARSLEVSA